MVSCLCPTTPRKHEVILYGSVSVLILNTMNLIFLEFGQIRDLFGEHTKLRIGKEYDVLESQNGNELLMIITSLLTDLKFRLFDDRSYDHHNIGNCTDNCVIHRDTSKFLSTQQIANCSQKTTECRTKESPTICR